MSQAVLLEMENTWLAGKGKLTEKDVDEALREVRLALLEADVNFKVVKNFVSRIRERAVGREVLESLTPGQQVLKIVNEELIATLGGGQHKPDTCQPTAHRYLAGWAAGCR
jgi:signal recognition particle subunit SRP54